MTELLWLIPALPAASLVMIALFFLREERSRPAPYLIIAALTGSFALSLAALAAVYQGQSGEHAVGWLSVHGFDLRAGTLLNPLSALMAVVVSLVSLLVQIYSIGYMHGDPGYGRYFAFMSLFTMSMLGLVVSNNLLQIYVFWELVGICSYLLIGFWYRRPAAAAAAKKAFVVTRFGDLGFLIGLLLLFNATGTFNLSGLEAKIPALPAGLITAAALLVFAGAVGKSAQFPLYVWLPDAMEGPTPVSALIHAATMVAAGVFLVARMYFLFQAAPTAMLVVAAIGCLTAFLAASMATNEDDIKRVLAYSTISQLGYMMLGLGVGGYLAGLFHLTTHAFFKALLFLCSGAVIHTVGSNNLWEMGGLGRKMKITAATMAVGSLALAGVWPLSGFYSKDEILVSVMNSHQPGHLAMLGVALAVVFMTAFYMTRLWFLAFTGSPRSATATHAHEAPAAMTGPLVALGVLAVVAGWAVLPQLGEPFRRLMAPGDAPEHGSMLVVGLSSGLALAGILVGWLFYGARVLSPARLANPVTTGIYLLFKNKYWIDYAYAQGIARAAFAVADAFAWFDRAVVNGMVDGIAWLAGAGGQALRRVQTGQLQVYALVVLAAVVLAMLGYQLLPPATMTVGQAVGQQTVGQELAPVPPIGGAGRDRSKLLSYEVNESHGTIRIPHPASRNPIPVSCSPVADGVSP